MHRLSRQTPEVMWANGEQIAKRLSNGDVAVLIFNRLTSPVDIVGLKHASPWVVSLTLPLLGS